MLEVVGSFTKPALELHRRLLSELCMSEVAGIFTNPLSTPPFCLLLRRCDLRFGQVAFERFDLFAYLRVVLGLVVAVHAVPKARRGCCPALPAAACCASC